MAKYGVNSSQLCLTEQSTCHTILGCNELTVWRVDWHPFIRQLLRSYAFYTQSYSEWFKLLYAKLCAVFLSHPVH